MDSFSIPDPFPRASKEAFARTRSPRMELEGPRTRGSSSCLGFLSFKTQGDSTETPGTQGYPEIDHG